jgi:nucleotide-binding universal stress UspA family protein
MFHHIMVPLDGWPLADHALPYALQLATAVGATVHLVYVGESLSNSSSPFPNFLTDAERETQLQRITEYLARLRRPLAVAGVQVHTDCIEEMPGATVLHSYERAARIDLVVVCTHWPSGWARIPSRSWAERLQSRSEIAVLHVPVSSEPMAAARGMTPSDGSARVDGGLDVASVPAA